MRFTNKHDLPEAVFKALTEDHYDAGESDYSVTTILKPPRMVQLMRRHDEELTQDAMDRLWSLLGTAVHKIFEDNTSADAVAELRVYLTMLGRKIGGQLDHYRDGVITDYKVTSAWSWVYGSRIKEWTEQQNIYAELYRENGFDIKQLQIMAVFRDWKETEYIKNPSQYPPLPIMPINLEIWPDDKVRDFIEYRTAKQIEAENLPDDELPLCTEQEMWAMPSKYAVYKNNLKRASRVLDSEEEAEAWIKQAKEKDKKASTYEIRFRPGKRNRCEKYCPAAAFCSQHKKFLAEQEKNKDDNSDD